MKKFFKIFLIVLLSIAILLIAVVLGLNVFKYSIYKDYFAIKTDLAINEGLGDGYIPQGVSKISYENKDYYLTSGYMTGNRPSRIYVISNNETFYVEVKLNDYDYANGHFGGIACAGNNVFISDSSQIYILNLDDIFATRDKRAVDVYNPSSDDVKVIKTVYVDVAASYIFIDDKEEFLYVGEFNDNKNYFTYHETSVNNGTEKYYAYVDKYYVKDILNAKNTTDPIAHYAVRDKVQGFAISDDKIVLSTSYGLPSSYFYVYDIPTTFDSENIYFLDDRYLTKTIKAPSMAEGLDYDGEQFITLYESASNKYIFGKFFFANKIVGLKI